jgi:hypothetical protein
MANYNVSIFIDSLPGSNQLPIITNVSTDASGNYTYTVSGNPGVGADASVSVNDCNGKPIENTFTWQNSNVVQNFTICVPDSIRGTVTLHGGGILPPTGVMLIYKYWDTVINNYSIQLIDSTDANVNGYYSFKYPNYNMGELLIKANIPSITAGNFMPTYHPSSLKWSGATAYQLPLSPGGITADIVVLVGINATGTAFIGGSVLQGANKNTGPGDPLPDRNVVLTDKDDKAIKMVTTDAQGKFSFGNMAYGDYKIFIDLPGKTCPPLPIALNEQQKMVDRVVFKENKDSFTGSANTSVNNIPASLAGVSVYPNPVKDVINISGLKTNAEVSVCTVTGAVVLSTTAKAGVTSIRLPELSSGIYFVKVKSENGTATYQIAK